MEKIGDFFALTWLIFTGLVTNDDFGMDNVAIS